MAIVQSVDFHAFKKSFEAFNRKDQFSPVALRMIFDYLEEYSESIGEPVELDVVGICCEFQEYTYSDAAAAYSFDLEGCEDDDDVALAVREYLEEKTIVVGYYDDTIVFMAF